MNLRLVAAALLMLPVGAMMLAAGMVAIALSAAIWPVAAELPRSGEDHLLLNFERQAFDADGKRINAFGPRGLSGGPLIDLGDFTLPANYALDRRPTPLLSGMLIEHRKEHNVILAVKIGPIVNAIRRSLAGR